MTEYPQGVANDGPHSLPSGTYTCAAAVTDSYVNNHATDGHGHGKEYTSSHLSSDYQLSNSPFDCRMNGIGKSVWGP
ncbi:hypothetical protein M405DRAFT_827671 [Rhizopogon salebrosus TDB-379]|nr:hypothetical protein M405DRAFT_827671 [Rhizopogon salebrosus TDB-379]